MKFSIRDLLLMTVIVALVLGWWVDHATRAWADKSLRDMAEQKSLGELRRDWQVKHSSGPLPISSAPTPDSPKD